MEIEDKLAMKAGEVKEKMKSTELHHKHRKTYVGSTLRHKI